MNNQEHSTRPSRTHFRLVVAALTAAAVLSVAAAFVWAARAGGGREPEPAPAAASQSKYPPVGPRAGHSDYLVGLTRRAQREGFGRDAVPLLAPGRGPGRAAVARRLRALAGRFGPRLTAEGLKEAPADDGSLSLIGPNSYLKVSADGTKFQFRGNIDDPREIERARSGRQLEKGELERLGRGFVKDALGEFVRLGREESLTFLGVKYLRNGTSEEGGQVEEEVVANIAVFGREVGGVPVIGPGSKVAVWFANDRRPVGFDVDWPVYNALRGRQRVLARERLVRRVQEATVSPAGADGAQVARFECGYVDLGATRRASQLQAGCSIHYVRRDLDGAVAARVEYVPAGEQVYADPMWPLAGLVARGRTIKTDTEEFARFASKNRPPAVDRSRDAEPAPRRPNSPRPRGRRRGRP